MSFVIYLGTSFIFWSLYYEIILLFPPFQNRGKKGCKNGLPVQLLWKLLPYYFWNFWILLVSFVLKMKDEKSLLLHEFSYLIPKLFFFWQACLFVIENLLHFWINFAHNVIFRPLISDQESGKIFPPFDWKDLSNPFVIFFFQIPNSNLYNKVQKKVTYVFPRDNSWYYNIICIFFFKLFSFISFKICLKMG